MIITRDGKKYRLNSSEMERAYQERLIYHQRIAVDNRMQERLDTGSLPFSKSNEIKQIALERYWEELRNDRFPDRDVWDKFIQYAIDVCEAKEDIA